MRSTAHLIRPAASRPWTASACLLLLVAGSVLAGCGARPGSTTGDGGRLERPLLRRLNPDGTGHEIQRVQHLVPPRKIRPWTVKAQAEPRARRLEDGGFGLRVDAWGKRRIAVPGSFPSETFNQVALQGVFPGVFSIQLKFTGPDDAQFDSSRMATLNTKEVQTVIFDLPRMRRSNAVYDELELLVTRGSKGFEVHSVDILDQPLALALPDPEGEGHLITIDHARHGVGVASGDPLSCTIEADPGATLRFAYGLPQELRLAGQEIRLKVSLTSADGGSTSSKTCEVDPRIGTDPVWKQVEIGLAAFDGPTEVRFEVETDGGDALCALAELAVLHPGEGPASVLLVTSDTHRADHLGSVDSVLHIETPALDALAERGVLFEDCYSSTNVTSPSHVALMTATHPRDTHLVTNSAHLSEQAETLAERFRAAGYMTIGVVSVRHLGPAGTGLGQGFDRMLAPISGTWDAEVAVGHVRDWLKDAQGVPVFVWMHLFDAHHPYGPPERFDRYYYPKNKNPFGENLPALQLDAECIPDDLLELRDLEYPKAQYRAEISYLDHELRRLLEHPRLRQGILAVTADHGEILEKDGTYFNHAALYPDTLHIPMILAWPGAPSGLRVTHGVEQIDLGRTLLDLSGLEGVEFPGNNLAADLEPSSEPVQAPRFALSANASSASVTLKPWHFVLYLRKYKGRFREERPKHSCELYRLDRDPECLSDLAPGEPKRVAQLRAMLIDWLTESSTTSLTASGQQSAAAMEQLAALGYATTTAELDDDAAWIDRNCDCEFCAEFP